MSNNDFILEVEKVSSGYGQSQVLFDVSLNCPKQGAIAILGRNGAGKSTLLKTIASEIDPLSGSIFFDKVNTATETTDKIVRRGLAYVPQEDAVFLKLTVQENLMLGIYNSKSIFFDFYSFNYKQDIVASPPPKGGEPIAQGTGTDVKVASATNPLGATKATELVPKEFTQSPSRMMTHILDVGTLPKGRTMEAQLEDTKDKKDKPNFDARDTMMQSIMRYNQMFTIRTDITIPGDFSLKAGDIIKCDFPEMYGAKTGNVNPESEGLYMIAHVCHRITPDSTLTSLSLVRDSYGDRG